MSIQDLIFKSGLLGYSQCRVLANSSNSTLSATGDMCFALRSFIMANDAERSGLQITDCPNSADYHVEGYNHIFFKTYRVDGCIYTYHITVHCHNNEIVDIKKGL